MSAPLENIRVVEVASFLAAPSAAALMADMGADVVKVEPPGGDPYRYSTTREQDFAMKFETNYSFHLDNRGKRSITVDLNQPGGGDVVRRLAAGADVFVTNLIQSRLERYGLTVEALRAINPRLVFASFTGYGIDTPDAHRPGFDSSAFWARSGIMGLLGGPDTPPPISRGGQGDHTCALNLALAILAALRMRDQTGQGQVVEVTLLGTGVWTIASDLSAALISHAQPARHDRFRPANPLRNFYKCRDGKWLSLSMVQPDRYWARFSAVVGHPEWADDPRYDTLKHRQANTQEITAALDTVFISADRAEWSTRLEDAGMIWGPVAELPEVIEDPAVRALGSFTTITDPAHGTFETLAAPFRIRDAEIAPRGPAPKAGEHTQAVLAEMGLSADEIARLAEQGVFG